VAVGDGDGVCLGSGADGAPTTRCRQRQVGTVRLGDNMSMAGGSAGNTVGAILVSSRRCCAEEEVAGAPVATGEWTTTSSGCHAAWPRGARGGDALVRRKEASACPAGVQGDGVAQARQQEVSSRVYSRGAREQMRNAGLGCFFLSRKQEERAGAHAERETAAVMMSMMACRY
jgi:hypothetical protein